VKRLKPFVALIVLALWASCTFHCGIEVLAHSTAISCCDEAGGESNQAPNQSNHCLCSFIQSGGFISQNSGVPMPLPNDALFVPRALPQADDFPLTPACAELIFPPPEQTKTWQFFCRAAASPRAPALLS
jgi:hypothetical protein